MLLSDTAIKNRTTVLVLVFGIILIGAVSYVSLPREAAPDVDIPFIVVTTIYEGVSPEDVESQITNEIEKELIGLKGVKEVLSTSSEGTSIIQIEFLPDVKIEDALQRVKDKVDIAKAELPTDEQRKEPIVSEVNVAEFPIMMINISGEVSPVVLKAIADELEDEIKGVPGVLGVDVLGAMEREIRIEVDPDRLTAYGLTVEELLILLPSENLNISAGGLETAGMKFNVRVPAEFRDPEKINNLMIAQRDGRPIYLTDVAYVKDTFKDRVNYSRLDGAASVTVAVKKRVGENIVEIATRVKAILAKARELAPATVKFELTLDQSDNINMMVKDLENNIVSGLILVVLVLVLFMGIRSSMLVALAIPLSFLMSVAIIQMLGYTLNMIVLFSLIMALGMLVDNAIVIVENIYRHVEMGYDRVHAAMKGAGEVAWPVITSTATTVAAFTPLLFWPGIMGDFMKYLPITVIIVLSSSLFVAMVITPVAASIFSGGGKHRRPEREARTDSAFLRGYKGLLRTAIRHRFLTLWLAMCVLAAILTAYGKYGAGVELFPETDPARAIVNLRGPQGMNIRDMNELALQVEKKIAPYRVDPEGDKIVDYVVTNVGTTGAVFADQAGGQHTADLSVLFIDYEDRKDEYSSEDAMKRIRAALTDVAGAEVKVEKEKEGPPTGAAVTVRIVGKDLGMLERLSERARRMIEDVPNLVNLRSDLESARPELRFEVDRERAKDFGLDSRTIGNFLKTAIFGSKVSTYREYKDDYDITIRLPEDYRDTLEDLLRLQVPGSRGKAVPLSSLGRFVYAPGLGDIHRVDQKRVVTLTGDAEGRLGTAVLADVEMKLDPLGYSPLLPADIADYQRFFKDLVAGGQSGEGPVADIWLRLGEDARRKARAAAASGPPDAEQEATMLAALDGLLSARDLYSPRHFTKEQTPIVARIRIRDGLEKLSEAELREVNRDLLAEAFASLFRPGAMRELPHRPPRREDLFNLGGFAEWLKDDREAWGRTRGKQIWQVLTPEQREAFAVAGEFQDRAGAVLDAINTSVIQDPFLFQSIPLEEGALGEEQKELLQAIRAKLDWTPPRRRLVKAPGFGPDPQAVKQAQRFNRLWVRSAFPGQIAERERLEMPQDYELRYAGEKEEQDEAQAFLLKAFGFALILIVGILVAQFNTLSVPLIIMTTVLLSTIGVFGGLLLFDMPFGIIMTGVGVISLAGVVVNNAIVLLDYTRQLQHRGKEVVEAAIEAGATRLRPVMLTATTTILGLVPMATGISLDFHSMRLSTRSETSQWWASMATAVIFGLAFATILTLVVVPSLYVMLYRLAAKVGLGGIKKAGEEKPATAVELSDY